MSAKIITYKKFYWLGIDIKYGTNQSGVSYAQTKNNLHAQLKAKEIYIKYIINITINNLKQKDKLYFLQHLLQYQKNKSSILDCMEKLMHKSPKKLAPALNAIFDNLKLGKSLGDSLSLIPNFFTIAECAIINIGEKNNRLTEAIEQLVINIKLHQNMQSKWLKALSYPITIFILAIAITIFLSVSMIPQLESLYTNFNTSLPSITQQLLNCSKFIRTHSMEFLLICSTLISVIYISCKKSIIGRVALEKILFNVPIIKTIIIDTTIMNWSHIIATSLSAGMTMQKSFLHSIDCIKWNKIRFELQLLIDAIQMGQDVETIIMQQNWLDQDTKTDIILAMKTASTQQCFLQIYQLKKDTVANKVERLQQILEPIAITILSAVICTLLLAIYMPIFKLGNIAG
jgi:type IV pilus assembly protein PilC